MGDPEIESNGPSNLPFSREKKGKSLIHFYNIYIFIFNLIYIAFNNKKKKMLIPI